MAPKKGQNAKKTKDTKTKAAAEAKEVKEVKEAPAVVEEAKCEETKADAVTEATGEKRKAEDATVGEEQPDAKEAKVESNEVKETETDAAADSRKKLSKDITFNPRDMTLNVLQQFDGKVLASLHEGPMQYFVAGARANVGVKAGRYMFDVQVVEHAPSYDYKSKDKWQDKWQRPIVRVGFSTAGSSLVLGESEEHFFFEHDGSFFVGKSREKGYVKLNRKANRSILLNLDPKSPNVNTVSLFVDGVRVTEPLPIPEKLHGKALFPHVSFRNVKISVGLGRTPAKPLPFNCRSIGDAAEEDTVKDIETAPKDGKYEVIFPVGFPDQGTFDWLDEFMSEHPNHVELSDRKIVEWARASGLNTYKSSKGCNDKYDLTFGMQKSADYTVRRVLSSITACVPRNYVVMEVAANLVATSRAKLLGRFSKACFKKVARVFIGEPADKFKAAQHEMIRSEKQRKADDIWHKQKTERERKKIFAEKQAQLKKEAEAKKAEAEAKKAAEKKAKEGDDEEKAAEETKEEKKEEAGDMAVDETAEEKAEPEETEPPAVELTPEEKEVWFAPKPSPDVLDATINSVYAGFEVPSKEEGFDTVTFDWQSEEDSKAFLKEWIVKRKRVTRIENLQPSAWFKEHLQSWTEKFQSWRAAQATFRKSPAGKKNESADDVDIEAVTDIMDVGEGRPLFQDFKYEDWALLQLRFDLYLLQEAFKHDADDPDRESIPEAHFDFYYHKYYRRQFLSKNFGCKDLSDVLKLIEDSVRLEEGLLAKTLDGDLDDVTVFVKRAEEDRKERERRLEAGDETVRLNILQAALPPQLPPPVKKQQGKTADAGKLTPSVQTKAVKA